MNYSVAVEYLTLPADVKQVRNTRTGEVWADIAPFSVAEASARALVEASWPIGQRISRLLVSPGGAAVGGNEDEIEQSFRVWSGSGKETLDVGMRVLVEICRDRDCELLVWPRVGSLVSDIPGLLSVSRKHEDVGIFLEPAAMLPAGEQFRLADFVDRFAEVLPVPSVCAVFFDAESANEVGGLAAFAPLVRLASSLEKPIVLRGISPENAAALFGLGPG